MRCGLYIRVSTEMQKERGESLDTQLKRLNAYVISKEDWSVVETYKDAGISAKNMNRPEFSRMMQDIDQRKIDVILCTKLDRLFRNTRDFLNTSDELEKKGITFVCLEGSIDTSTPAGRVFSTMRAAFAQFERETTAERVRDVMRSRAEQGKWNGGITPYGYSSKDKLLIVNDKEAKVVMDIYNSYLLNRSIRKTVHKFNADGKRTRDNDLWTLTSIKRMLKNPCYYGALTYSKRSHSYSGELKRNDKHILSMGKHPAIVSRELFDKVQAIIQQQTKTAPRSNAKYMLTGIVYCGICGARMHGMKTGRTRIKHTYYRCSGHSQKGKCQCSGNGIRVDTLEPAIIDSLKNLSINKGRLKELLVESADTNDKSSDVRRGRLKPLENKLAMCEDKRSRIFELYEEGSINKNDFLARKATIDQDESSIKAQIEQLASQPGSDIGSYDLDYTINQFKDIKEVYDELDIEDKKETIMNLVPEIRVNKHDISYDIQIPSKLLTLSKETSVFAYSDDTGRGSSPRPA